MEILQELEMHTLSKLQNFQGSFIALEKFPKLLQRSFFGSFHDFLSSDFIFAGDLGNTSESPHTAMIALEGVETCLWYM